MTKKRLAVKRTVLIIFILFILIYLIPYLWLVGTSFKTRVEAFSIPPKIMFKPIIENYKTVFIEKEFLKNLLNSIIVVFFVTSISLSVGIPSAYAFSRFRMKGDKVFFFYLLGTRFTPVIVLSLPLYFIMANLKLLDTFVGIIIAHSAFNIAFVVWMMKGFFDTIPKEIDEAARIDGCSWFGALLRITAPLAANGIVATSIFCAINSWNEFLMAMILTRHKTATLPVAIPGLMTPQGTFWGQIAAVGSVITIPVLIFTFIVQKYMVQGMSMGAIKQ